jgi:hypothetical protein
MELLIQLVIWLFRNLFGEQEEPAQVGPRPIRRPTRRQAPPTLAELLEEARREAADRTSEEETIPTKPVEPVYAPREEEPAPPPPYEPIYAPPAPTARPATERSRRGKRPKVESLAIPQVQPAVVPAPAAPRKIVPHRRIAAIPGKAAKGVSPLVAGLRMPDLEARRRAARMAIAGMVVFGPPRCRRGGRI